MYNSVSLAPPDLSAILDPIQSTCCWDTVTSFMQLWDL